MWCCLKTNTNLCSTWGWLSYLAVFPQRRPVKVCFPCISGFRYQRGESILIFRQIFSFYMVRVRLYFRMKDVLQFRNMLRCRNWNWFPGRLDRVWRVHPSSLHHIKGQPRWKAQLYVEKKTWHCLEWKTFKYTLW